MSADHLQFLDSPVLVDDGLEQNLIDEAMGGGPPETAPFQNIEQGIKIRLPQPHRTTRPGRSDKPTVHGMHDGLKPIVGAELLVNVVEMVAKRLQGDPKTLGDFGRILSV